MIPHKRPADAREHFMELYKELYDHTGYLEDSLDRLIHREKVDRPQLESHLAQMLTSLSLSHKKHLTLKYTRKGKRRTADVFHNEMVKVTRVVKDQAATLLKTSFLVEKGDPGLEYIQTLSDIHDNILGGFQLVLRSNILIPIVLN